MQPTTTYPVQFSVDYPDRALNRVSTAFRIIVMIPIAIVLGAYRAAAAGTPQRAAGPGREPVVYWSLLRC